MKAYLDPTKQVINYKEQPDKWDIEVRESVEQIEQMPYSQVIELIKTYIDNLLPNEK